jgi:peroxiredoxin (alkyl hydroperoxide reductase subunit C)
MVEIGERAPDFTAKDENNNDVTLSQFRGKNVLLAFFPFAFSPVCTDEMKCFQSDLPLLNRVDTQVIGISVDSHWTQNAFKKSLGIDFPLLSDFDRSICKLYGTLRPNGFSNRAYFIIDKNGTVKYKHFMDLPSKKLEDADLIKVLSTLGS